MRRKEKKIKAWRKKRKQSHTVGKGKGEEEGGGGGGANAPCKNNNPPANLISVHLKVYRYIFLNDITYKNTYK